MNIESYFIVDRLTKNEIQRIFTKIEVDPISKCWNWIAALSNGYGHIYYRGKTAYVHRLVYAWLIAPLQKGRGTNIKVIDHLCNNRKCCNPFHLNLVFHKENILRGNGVSAICFKKTHCVHGHKLDMMRNNGKRYCSTCSKEYNQKRNKTEKRKMWQKKYSRRRYLDNPEPYKQRAKEQRERNKLHKLPPI